jgi:hypothetical protein
MSEQIQPKKSFFDTLLRKVNICLNKKKSIEQNLSFDEFMKSFLIIIPVHAILYLWEYYDFFDVKYFMYFNPIDFINTFYTNNLILLVYIVFISFIGLYFFLIKIIFRKKFETNKLLIYSYLFFLLLLVIIKLEIHNTPFLLFSIMGLIIFAVISIGKEIKLTYFTVIIFYFFYTLSLAKKDALLTKENKPNFNIILNDNTYALKKDTINHKDFFIGKITDYVFIYSDSLKKVRVIPVKEIKEIQFSVYK